MKAKNCKKSNKSEIKENKLSGLHKKSTIKKCGNILDLSNRNKNKSTSNVNNVENENSEKKFFDVKKNINENQNIINQEEDKDTEQKEIKENINKKSEVKSPINDSANHNNNQGQMYILDKMYISDESNDLNCSDDPESNEKFESFIKTINEIDSGEDMLCEELDQNDDEDKYNKETIVNIDHNKK